MRPDIAITTRDEDALNYAPFAQEVAGGLIHAFQQSDEAFVIGIHGPWGVGKSSLINLMFEEIEQHYEQEATKDQHVILRFNPWLFTGQQELQLIFLKELYAKLYATRHKAVEITKALGNFIKRYEHFSKTVKTAIPSDLKKLIDTLGKNSVPYWNTGKKALQQMDAYAKRLGKSADEWVQAESDKLDLHTLKKEVDKALKDSRTRLYISIDDIDRLTFAEIEAIFQLVKLNANFANTIFILAYDHEVVVHALDQKFKGRGKEYLEKIVQVDYGLPKINRFTLKEMLRKGVAELFKDFNITPDLDQLIKRDPEHWKGIESYIRTIRDLNRYLNAVKLRLGRIWQEVDVMDFLVLEVLRVFELKAYEFIWEHRDILTFSIYGFDQVLENLTFETWSDDLSDNEGVDWEAEMQKQELSNRAIGVVKVIFRYALSTIKNMVKYQPKSTYTISRKEYIGRYFKLQLGTNEISRDQIKAFKADANNNVEVLEQAVEQRQVDLFLAALKQEPRSSHHDSECVGMLGALVDVLSKKDHVWSVQIEENVPKNNAYWEKWLSKRVYVDLIDFERYILKSYHNEDIQPLLNVLKRDLNGKNTFDHFKVLTEFANSNEKIKQVAIQLAQEINERLVNGTVTLNRVQKELLEQYIKQ